MSQAEVLLNTLSEDGATVYSRNSETEGRIVIGNDRKITVPESLKRIAVQHDHNIETVTFDCPRYWDSHDMSTMKVYITYLLPDGTIGSYLAQNITALGNTMSFTWTISSNVTLVNGNISFLVCIKRTDADGNEELHWNSELNTDCYVSEGIEGAVSVVTKYPDIVTQLLTRMDEVEAIATVEAMQSYTDTWLEANHDRVLAEIEAKGVATLTTIPEDYTTTYNAAVEAVRTKSNAIVCEAEGESIVINDSSDDYVRGLKVFGKSTQDGTPTPDNPVEIVSIENPIISVSSEYTPYTVQNLEVAHTLPGIPVTSGGNYTDSDGQQWVCDEIDLERGKYVQRIKTIILDGSSNEGWTLYDNNASQGMSFVYYPYGGVTYFQSSMCDKYRNVNGCWGEPHRGQTGIYSDHNSVSGRYFRPPNESVDSLESWLAWLSENPLTLMYILAIPIETPLSAEEIAAFKALRTNYPNTTVLNDAGAWVKMEYNADTKLYIENKITSAIDAYLAEHLN